MESNNTNALFDLIQSIQSKLNDEQKDTDTFNDNSNIEKDNNEKKSNTNNNFNISDILNGFNSTTNNKSDNSFDLNTISRIQKIISSMNKNDPRKNLLLSLKPFLRKSRQDKINEYMTYLSIASALGIFDSKGSDSNDI